MKRFKEIISACDDLKIKMYYMVLITGIFSAGISLLADLMQGMKGTIIISTACCLVSLIILFYLSVYLRIEKFGRHVLVYLMNIVLFPLCFLDSGLNSGMILVYLLGLFSIGILLEGRGRYIAYLISLIAMEISIILSYIYPGIFKTMDPRSQVVDVVVTLVITSLTMIVMLSMILNAYDNERKKINALNERLRELSVKDELSGLYNRRELFRRLEFIYQTEITSEPKISDEHYFIAMFDIDNFKSLNDTYGHQFGDKVLAGISHSLKDHVTEEHGELAARYGGEEFVCIIRSDTKDNAFERVDEIRKGISELKYEENPDLTVTVSGGICGCEEYKDLNLAIHNVDALLYKAKKSGKNRMERN